MPVSPVNRFDAIIWTEGKTDWKHLRRAAGKLGLCLNIEYHENEDRDMGGEALLNKCQIFAQTFQTTPLIFVFDRDKPSIVKAVLSPDGSFKDWGNNVFSMAIPVPSHRQGQNNTCIEMYYTDKEITTLDQNGRRLYLSSEFKETSGNLIGNPSIHLGNAGRVKGYAAPENAKIIDSDVFHGDANIALSKDNFAEYVLNDVHPFGEFQVEEFRKIFDLVAAILHQTTPRGLLACLT